MRTDLRFGILFASIIASCETPSKNVQKIAETDSSSQNHSNGRKRGDTCYYSLRDNAQICDTCWSTLIVEHNECTECQDLFVDSGTVYLNHKILYYFDSLFRQGNLWLMKYQGVTV